MSDSTRLSRRTVAFLTAAVLAVASLAIAQTQQVRVGGVIQEPKKLKHVDPVYPEDARVAGAEGAVVLDLTIATDGSVVDAKVLNPQPPFVEPALAAVRQWRYTPTVLNGQPVEVLMTVTVTFSLKADPSQGLRIRVGGVVPEPRLLTRVEPLYPADALAAGVGGTVMLDVGIGKDGSVVDARVLRPVPMFQDAALDAVRQWKYAPSLLNGEPVEVLMIVTIHFKPTPETPRVPVGGEVAEPTLLKHVAPVYPRIAILGKMEGMVIIEAVIGTDGSIIQAKALRPSPLFEAAALDAVRQWRYTPTLLNGAPVEVTMVVTVSFTLR